MIIINYCDMFVYNSSFTMVQNFFLYMETARSAPPLKHGRPGYNAETTQGCKSMCFTIDQ